MKTALLLATACTIASSQAVIWELNLGPNGLNAQNERPVPGAPSTATGHETVDYDTSLNTIRYDSVTKQLELHFGWGNVPSAGLDGVNLSSELSPGGLHIHGPSDVNNSASILYHLTEDGFANDVDNPSETEYFFPLANDGASYRAAAYDGTIQLVEGRGGFTIAQQEAQLLGNQWYINVHTVNFLGGEIRGQLLNPIPEPEHYAAIAGLALLGFAGYRRFRTAKAV